MEQEQSRSGYGMFRKKVALRVMPSNLKVVLWTLKAQQKFYPSMTILRKFAICLLESLLIAICYLCKVHPFRTFLKMY